MMCYRPACLRKRSKFATKWGIKQKVNHRQKSHWKARIYAGKKTDIFSEVSKGVWRARFTNGQVYTLDEWNKFSRSEVLHFQQKTF